MKLYYITNSRIPTEKAHGLQIVKTCEALSDAGAALELVLPTRKNRNLTDVDIYEYYRIKNNFFIKKLSTFDPRFLLKLRAPAGTFIKIQTLLFGWSVTKYLRSNKINSEDIIYTRDQYLLPLLFKFSNQVVWEAHNLPKNKARYARYWKKCTQIITITQGLKDELVQLGLSQSKILVAPDGVDLKIFSPTSTLVAELRKNLSLPQDKKIVLYTGHLYDWKGAQILAQAASQIDKSAVVVFLGGNDKAIAQFKSEYGSQDDILVLGRVEHHRVPGYLQAADVLVLPNSGQSQISTSYTSPLKLFEYMAAKKPIVASNLPSIREVLNEQNALLVAPDNPTALAQGINQVLSDSTLAEKISNQAYAAVGQYSWGQRAKNILAFLTL